MKRIFLFASLFITASAWAEGIEARLPATDGVTEQWLMAVAGDQIEIHPAEREDAKDQIILFSDSKLDSKERLEAAVIFKNDGSVVSTALDSGDILWRTDQARGEQLDLLERDLAITTAEVEGARGQLQQAEAALQKRAGMAEVTEIQTKIFEIDQKIKALSAAKSETPVQMKESKPQGLSSR